MASYTQEESCQAADIRSTCSARALAGVSRLGLAAQELAPCCHADGAGEEPCWDKGARAGRTSPLGGYPSTLA